MIYRSHDDYPVFEINVKGFQPYYTDDEWDAVALIERLRHITRECSMRKTTYYRMLKKKLR